MGGKTGRPVSRRRLHAQHREVADVVVVRIDEEHLAVLHRHAVDRLDALSDDVGRLALPGLVRFRRNAAGLCSEKSNRGRVESNIQLLRALEPRPNALQSRGINQASRKVSFSGQKGPYFRLESLLNVISALKILACT